MPQHSAGLLLFDDTDVPLRVFLAHMGGPLWARKDNGAWSIPKGLYDPATEDPRDAARREFAEEIGVPPPQGELMDLGEQRQRSGKRVRVYASPCRGGLTFVSSNPFTMEWPPKSGQFADFPEMDRAEWFPVPEARGRLVAGQLPFLDVLVDLLEQRRS